MNKDQHTISEHFLDVGDGHSLYVQEWGNADAKTPIIFLHGGPGAGCNDKHKQMFDSATQRVIFFDQRGSGRSLPSGSLIQNTTDDMIADIEKIVHHYNLKKFIITGGSWGSCLAFAYALKHPERVHAMVLRGIFTGSKEETDYLDNGMFQLFYPDVWDAYLKRTPKEHQHNPSAYHYQQIKSIDGNAVKASSYAYSELEGSLLTLDDRHTEQDYQTFEPGGMNIELHYLANLCFMPDRYILDNAHKIEVPVWLVQGRYDMVCPPKTAYEMHQKLPNSKLLFTTAGHSGGDRGIYEVMSAVIAEVANPSA
jgi:proline iminopeptidase